MIYEYQEGRGIGLMAKLEAYELQDAGLDTVEANHALGFKADCRDFGLPAAILRDLGIKRVRLLSNNPRKASALTETGIEVVAQLQLRGCAESALVGLPADQEGKNGPRTEPRHGESADQKRSACDAISSDCERHVRLHRRRSQPNGRRRLASARHRSPTLSSSGGHRRHAMDEIVTERSEGILRVELNRPKKRNAMTSSMYMTLADIFNDAAKDERIRVVLWHGAGDSFCAGNDIEDF